VLEINKCGCGHWIEIRVCVRLLCAGDRASVSDPFLLDYGLPSGLEWQYRSFDERPLKSFHKIYYPSD